MSHSSLPPEIPKKSNACSCGATVIGIISCAMIASALFVPWYQVDYHWNSSPRYHDQYGVLGFTRDGTSQDYPSDSSSKLGLIGGVMELVAVVLTIGLIAAVVATVMSFRHRTVPGVVSGAVSAAFLLLACSIFYFGVVDALGLDGFSGYSAWNKTETLVTAPMIGWWISAVAPMVQGAQVVFLAYSGTR
jgi:hypothetical protein